jgi:hypothetical protein
MVIRRAEGTSSFAVDLDALIKYWRSRGTTVAEIEQALSEAVVVEDTPKDEQDG